MGTMYPREIYSLEGVTDGERQVFGLLEEVAKPDRDFACFYEPYLGIEGKAPDFVVLSRSLGILIIEVKDWAFSQIQAADPFKFRIRLGGDEVCFTNPDRQAKGYVHALMRRLKGIPGMVSRRAGFDGKLKVSIAWMVAFPHIQRRDYIASTLRDLIPPERVLFQDDLDPAGPLVGDRSGRPFQERLDLLLPFPSEPLTAGEFQRLKDLLYPEMIQLPQRSGPGKSHFQRQVLALDEEQSRLARRLGRGHQIIKGPPGSGKTLVLVHRCCQLRRYHPRIGRILLVCFNIALASYLKRLLQEKGIGIGENGVEVSHFYELCAAVLGERVEFNQADSDYYQLVIHETLDALAGGKNQLGTFGVVLLDEGQDFSNEMLRVVLGVLAQGGDLILALDSYQDLYRREASWRSLGIEARGRTHYLGNAYRNTAEIFEFSQRFIGTTPKEHSQTRLPLDCLSHGDPPQLLHFSDLDKIEAFLETSIRERVAGGEYQRSEIAVIYDDKTYGLETFTYDNRDLPLRLRRRLEQAGIPVKWVSEDVRAKEMFDITTDRVSLISVHSAKGLDFDLVYLVGVDHIIPTDKTSMHLTRLIYVAITRARHRLVIPFVEKTEFIERMITCNTK